MQQEQVRRYVEADGWMAYSRRAGGGKLEDQEEWLKERFFRHRGNAEVVRQDLLREQSTDVSVRTVERAVAPFCERIRTDTVHRREAACFLRRRAPGDTSFAGGSRV